MIKTLFPALLLGLLALPGFTQNDYFNGVTFTKADTLRGMLTPERTCYDVTYYDLNVAIDVNKHFIKGYVDIHFKVASDFASMQVDLYKNMKINEITWNGLPLTHHRLFDAVLVYLPDTLKAGSMDTIRVVYEGFPQTASNPPWDGGFVWAKDQKNKPWVGVACEGDGASLWWPCKDHLSDEPDSMSIRVAVPRPLVCVANGNLRKMERLNDGFMLYDWFVSYPINNYNVTVNIAAYQHFADTYISADGDSLKLDYYVLGYNLEKAKKHFEQVKPVLACYEKFFGKFPFWRDGYALVETPYLGMEHQSAIAYGNMYLRGYLGGMIPHNMDWDYIIVHESGHEYFGNAISMKDHADMWIHEAFTTYMEALYVEYIYSKEDAIRYLESQRPYIVNREPILGPINVNWDNWEGSDHYFKGAWMLHTLRSVLDNDEQWFALLRAIYEKFKFQTIATADVVKYINEFTGKDFTRFFRQYLGQPDIPRFAFELEQNGNDLKVRYQWIAEEPGFDMPVKIGKPGSYVTVFPVTNGVQETVIPNLNKGDFEVATELFYVKKTGL